jgi:hypothetical protein
MSVSFVINGRSMTKSAGVCVGDVNRHGLLDELTGSTFNGFAEQAGYRLRITSGAPYVSELARRLVNALLDGSPLNSTGFQHVQAQALEAQQEPQSAPA